MPHEAEAEAIARQAREDLERDLFNAQQRVPGAEARAKEALEAIEAKQRQTQREQEEAAAAARRAGDKDKDFFDLSDESGSTIGRDWGPSVSIPDGELIAKSIAAEGEAEAARADVERIRRQIADLPPAEDILGDIGEGADRTGVLVAVGGGADDSEEKASRATFLRAAGLALALGGLVLLWQSLQQQQLPVVGQQPAPSAPAQSASAKPSAAPSAASAPPPIAELPPLTGSALALVDFTRTNSCPSVAAFTTGYRVDAVDGTLTLTQVDVGHVSNGTVDRDGAFETKGDDQTYSGLITGTWFRGKYAEPGGCTYDFDGQLTRPFLEVPPFGSAPGRFEFVDLQTNLSGLGLLDVAPGASVHVIVASDGEPDISTQLPIRVLGTAGDDTIWDFTIDGDPAVVCRGPTGCSANAPTPRLAAWDDENLEIVIVATGSGNDVIAVHAPHGVPAVAPAPSTAPSVAPTLVPSSAPSVGISSPAPSTPPAATGGGGPNVPLAAAGTALLLGGLTLAAGGVGRRRRPYRSPDLAGEAVALGELLAPERTVSDAAADLAAKVGVDPRPPVQTTVSPPSVDPLRDEIERKARSLEQQAARKEAEAARYRGEEERPIGFDEAFVDTVNALGGAASDSGAPVSFILNLEEEAKRLRAEAAALRGQLKP